MSRLGPGSRGFSQRVGATFRTAGPLALGNASGAIVGLAGLALIPRLYGAAEYGRYAVILSVGTVVNGISTLRLDQKIPYAPAELVPKLRHASWLLLAVATGVSLLVASAVGGIRAGFALPIGGVVFCLGAYARATFLGLREERFARLGLAYTGAAVTQILVQLGAGMIAPTSLALVGGYCLGRLCGAAIILTGLSRGNRPHMPLRAAWQTIWAEKSWWRPLVGSSLLGTAALQIFVPMVVFYYGAALGGAVAFWTRIFTAPTSVIGTAVAQWFATALRDRPMKDVGELYANLVLLMSALSVTVIGTIAGLALAAQPYFVPSEWQLARGAILAIGLLAAGELAVAPGIHVFGYANATGAQFRWDAVRFALVVPVIALGPWLFGLDVTTALLAYAGANLLAYAWQVRVVKTSVAPRTVGIL